MAADDFSSLEVSVETPLSCQKTPNDESSCTSIMVNYFVRKNSYGTNHPHQMEHGDHLMMMMTHTYTPLSLVAGEAFLRMVTYLDPSIQPITRSKLTRTFIPHKLKNPETDVSSLIDGVRFVVISYYLWMSKTTQEIFSIMAHYTCENVREHAHIGMPITT